MVKKNAASKRAASSSGTESEWIVAPRQTNKVLRTAVHAVLAASALTIATVERAEATCTDIGTTLYCSGNEQPGIWTDDYRLGLTVFGLTTPIAPTSGRGITFFRDDVPEAALTFYWDGSQSINGTNGEAIYVFNFIEPFLTGRAGDITATTMGGTINAFGSSSYDAFYAQSYGQESAVDLPVDGGNVVVNNRSNINNYNVFGGRGIFARSWSTYSGLGGNVTVDSNAAIQTRGLYGAHGIFAVTEGGYGANGSSSFGGSSGVPGGNGGNVFVYGSGSIRTTGVSSHGILAVTRGGIGGSGGDGWVGNAGNGVFGGDAGEITISGSWNITTSGQGSAGIFAESLGGEGGQGGRGYTFGSGGGGGGSGDGHTVSVESHGTINTTGAFGYGIFAHSVGGFAGSGGSSYGIVGYGGSGQSAGYGGEVYVKNYGVITTRGTSAHAIYAQSVGGGGGAGGNSGGVVSVGGGGAAGGNGSLVDVENYANLFATGANARGIFAQSIGGGGGDGGDSGGVAAIGGAGSGTSDGGKVDVYNSGNIVSSAHAIFAESVGGGGGNGGSSTGWFSVGGSGGSGGNSDTVTVENHGSLTTQQANSSAIFAHSVGGGGGNGGSSTSVGLGVSLAIGGNAAEGGDGNEVSVTSTGGLIETGADYDSGLAGDRSHGIFAQSVGGAGGNGGHAFSGAVSPGASLAIAMGGSGGGGGDGKKVTVTSGNSILTHGDDANGIFAESLGGGGGNGGFAIAISAGSLSASMAIGGTGAGGGHADTVDLTSTGTTIQTIGDRSNGMVAQSVGGGGGNGGFAVAGTFNVAPTVGAAFAVGGNGGTGGNALGVRVESSSNILTSGDDANGLFAQSVGGGGGNGGFAVGATISGGAAVSAGVGGNGGGGGYSGVVEVGRLAYTSGLIHTQGDNSKGLFAQSVGGGGGNGGFAVAGSISASPGANLSVGGNGGTARDAQEVIVHTANNVITEGRDSHGMVAQSIGGGGGTGGFAVSGGISATGTVGAGIGGKGGGGGAAEDVTLYNHGQFIDTSGEHSYGLFAQSVGGGGGDGGFAVAGSIGMGPAANFAMGGSGTQGGLARDVRVENTAAITTRGNEAHALFAQSVGGGGGSGGFAVTGSLSASGGTLGASIGGDGAGGGAAGIVNVLDDSSGISTNGNSAIGIFAQSVGGGGGNGGFAIGGSITSGPSANLTLGGNAGAGSNSGVVTVRSDSSIGTIGSDSHGIFAQSVGGGGGNGGFAVTGSVSASGSINAAIGGRGNGGGDAEQVLVVNHGSLITTTGTHSYGVSAQSLGGGGGDGGFAIAGGISAGATANLGVGGTGAGGGIGRRAEIQSTSSVATTGNDSHGLFVQSVGGGGGSGGFSVAAGISNANAGASFGGRGGGGGNAGDAWLTTAGASISTAGDHAHGALAQSIGGGGGDGGFSVTGGISNSGSASLAMGGSGNGGGNGLMAMLTSTSSVSTSGNDAHGLFAQSVGGGGGSGGFAVSGNISLSGAASAAIGGSGAGGGSADFVRLRSNGAAISTEGDRSYGIVAQSVGGGGGDGGFAVAGSVAQGPSANFAMGGSGATAGHGREVQVFNTSAIATLGNESHGLFAQSVGGGGGSGGFAVSGSMSASGGSLGAAIGGSGNGGGVGGLVTVDTRGANNALISTVGNRSTGILAQSVGGGGGTGGFAIAGNITNGPSASLGIGGNGGTGSDADIVTVLSDSSVATEGDDSHGIFAQSVGGGGGDGGFAIGGSISATGNINAAIGGTGAGGGNAQDVSLTSHGASVSTQGTHSYGIVAQSLGGGGGDGGFSVAAGISNGGSANLSLGGSGSGGGIGRNVLLNSSTQVSTLGNDAHGVFAQSIGGGGGSGGFSVVGGISRANAGASIGGSGAGGGNSGTVTLINTATSVATAGEHAYGVIAQSIGGGGGDGGFSVAGGISNSGNAAFAMGGSGAGGGDGQIVSLTSSSIVLTQGNDSHGLFAQSVGGGGGSGGFAVAGAIANNGAATAALGGSGAGGGDANNVSLSNTGSAIATFGNRSFGVAAQSIGGGGGDGGFAVSGSITKGPAANFSMGGSAAQGGVGRDVTLNSTSAIETDGNDAHAIFAQSVGGGGGSGGFSVSGSISADSGTIGASIGGSGGAGGNGGKVSLGTTAAITGTLNTFGDRAYGILAQSVGGGGGDGGFSVAAGISKGNGVKFSMGGSGGTGSNSDEVSVRSAASIHTGGNDSHGIFAQSIGGGGGSGGFSVAGTISTSGSSLNASIGGSGAGGGNAESVSVASTGTNIGTEGDRAFGIVAQSIGGGGGDGGFSVAGSIDKQRTIGFSLGGSGDVGGNADSSSVLSSSNITTLGAESHGIFAQSVGGGGGSGGFSVTGSLFAQNTGNTPSIEASIGGSGAGGGDAGAVNVGALNNFVSGDINTTGVGAHGIFAQSLGGGGGNGGFSVAGGLSQSPGIKFSLGGSAGTGSSSNVVSVFTAANVTTRGDGGHGVFAQSLGGGGGNGGFSVAGSATRDTTSVNASIGGAGGGGGHGDDVGVTNSGRIITLGGDAYGVFAQSIGGGGGNGGFSMSGSLTAPPTGAKTKKPANNIEFSMGGDGGNGDRGGNVTVSNTGVIDTAGAGSHGILAHSLGGGGGTGGFSGSGTLSFLGTKSAQTRVTMAVSVGGDGGSGDAGGTVDVTNTRDITTRGSDARGIYAYSVGGGGGSGAASYAADISLGKVEHNNGFNFEFSIGGKGGNGNVSDDVTVTSSGRIVTLGDRADGIYAQSIGGGGGDGGISHAMAFDFTKEKKPAPAKNGSDPWNFTTSIGGSGGTADDGAKVTVTNTGNIDTSGALSRGIVAQSVGGGGGAGAKGIQGTGIDLIDTGTELLDLRDRNFFSNVFDLRSWSITVGGNGGQSGDGKDVVVTNSGSIVTRGLSGFGIFAQSIGGGGGEAQNFARGTGDAGTAVAGINAKFAIGGAGGASGDGGKVTITNSNSIVTFGNEAHGIFAQSIGGGGGLAGNVDRGFTTGIGGLPVLNIGVGLAVGQNGGSAGDGNDVTVTNNGSITTSGNAAYGILAQSIGGGGGAAGGLGNEGTFAAPVLRLQNFYGSAGGSGNGGVVSVNQTGAVSVTGGNAIGIFAQSTTNDGIAKSVNVTTSGDINAVGVGSFGILAQSLGKQNANALLSSDNIAISVNGGTIRGGVGAPPPGAVSLALTENEKGAAINFRDGKNNTLVNRGNVGDAADLTRMAVLAEGANEAISNFGSFYGVMNLGGGANSFTNQSTGSLTSGASLNLGAGNTLTNGGTWSIGNQSEIARTSVDGNVNQLATGRMLVDLDFANYSSDRVDVTNGNASMSGSVVLNRMNTETIKPGNQQIVLVSATGGVTMSGLTINVTPSAITNYSLATTAASGATPGQLVLSIATDFAPDSLTSALTPNQAALGDYFNSIASAGTPTALVPTVQQVIAQSDVVKLGKLYDGLSPDTHLASQTMPFYDVTRFSEALLSCKQFDGDYRFSGEEECAWMNFAPNWRQQDAVGNTPIVKSNGMALAAGFQREFSEHWHYGLGASYDTSTIESERAGTNTLSQRARGNGGNLGAVVKANYGPNTLSLSATGGQMKYEVGRFASQVGPTVMANSDQDVNMLAAHLRYSFLLEGSRWYAKPLVDAGYTSIRRGAFQESGAGATGLNVAAESNHITTVQPMFEVGGEMTTDGGAKLRLFGRAGLTQLLSGEHTELTATFQSAPSAATPFTVSQSLDKRTRDLTAGLDFLGANGAVLRVSYTDSESDSAESRSANLKLSLPIK